MSKITLLYQAFSTATGNNPFLIKENNMAKPFNKPLALAISTTLISSFASTAVIAETTTDFAENPFTLSELSNGYMQLAKSDATNTSKMKDGACGEGKCGSSMMKGAEEKTVEGNCAGNKPMPKNSSSSTKSQEAKCGEGKCGADMK
jgi:uncharacterized low-complexity protein